MTTENFVKLEGVILQKFAPRKIGKATITDFVLKTKDGDVRVATFKVLPATLICQTVSFDAKYSEQYKNYSVQTEITPVGGAGTPTATATEAEPQPKSTRKYTRKQADAPTNETPVQTSNVFEDLEAVRPQAEQIIQKDLLFARTYLGNDASADAQAILVQALQAVRATLFIERNKRDRFENIKR